VTRNVPSVPPESGSSLLSDTGARGLTRDPIPRRLDNQLRIDAQIKRRSAHNGSILLTQKEALLVICVRYSRRSMRGPLPVTGETSATLSGVDGDLHALPRVVSDPQRTAVGKAAHRPFLIERQDGRTEGQAGAQERRKSERSEGAKRREGGRQVSEC
jgi:hypothetical protein